MASNQHLELSFVVAAYNEQAGIRQFHTALLAVLENLQLPYEIIYCNDGSTDNTLGLLKQIAAEDKDVRIITLSRNFGKEIATTAGLHAAVGKAIIMLDADGQHPVELIPQFVERWQAGNEVVVGVRIANQREGLIKRYGSKLFYGLFNRLLGGNFHPGATDYRLIDKIVQAEFTKMTERNRVTRGLIDWLGYQQDYIYFKANPRLHGEPTYSFGKLFKLAIDSVVSLSISPLYIAAYVGAVVLPISLLVGLVMAVNVLFGDPLSLHATGGAYLTVFILFLIGILLMSQGIIGLYLSHIHTETQGRPLYIIDRDRSIRL